MIVKEDDVIDLINDVIDEHLHHGINNFKVVQEVKGKEVDIDVDEVKKGKKDDQNVNHIDHIENIIVEN